MEAAATHAHTRNTSHTHVLLLVLVLALIVLVLIVLVMVEMFFGDSVSTIEMLFGFWGHVLGSVSTNRNVTWFLGACSGLSVNKYSPLIKRA